MTHLVVGYGEVGAALYAVLQQGGLAVDAYDNNDDTDVPPRTCAAYTCAHICVPFTDLASFIDVCASVIGRFQLRATDLLVIHSTVPLGTTDRVGDVLGIRTVHSPVRGVHPHLAEGIRTFRKYIGGKHAPTVSHEFVAAGLSTRCYESARTTEAIKLWDTTQYGWQIVLAKEIAVWCAAHGLDFDHVYRFANHDYNEGYEDLGKPHVVRPALHDMPGPIGGHCVVPNLGLLDPNLITAVIAFAQARYLRGETAIDPTSRPARDDFAFSGAKSPIPESGIQGRK